MEIQLYHKWKCPYSAKVREVIERNELEDKIEYRDIEEETYREELQKFTGKTQVPCMVIDNKPMLESDEIVTWIEKNLNS